MLEKRFEIRQEEQKIDRVNQGVNQEINKGVNQEINHRVNQGEVCDFGKGWCGWGFRSLRVFVLLFIISLIFLFSTPAFADPGWRNSSWNYKQ